jgi:hypothetical protein
LGQGAMQLRHIQEAGQSGAGFASNSAGTIP